MAVKIRLTRLGKIRNPQYRIAVVDARARRDGRSIEVIGRYHPKEDPSLIEVDTDRAPVLAGRRRAADRAVLKLLKITGDWQKFKVCPAPKAPCRSRSPSPASSEPVQRRARRADGAPSGEAVQVKKKAPARRRRRPKTEPTETAEAGGALPEALRPPSPAAE